MHVIESKELDNGITVKVVLDDHGTDSPLDGDGALKMVVLHRRYIDPAKGECGETPDEVAAWARANAKDWQTFPLYMMDHGNTAYSIESFGDPWDSGRVGIVAVQKSEFPRGRRKAAAISICETYTAWANGEVYGYVVEDEDGETLDSCWGYIGEADEAMAAGIEAARYHVTERKDTLNTENCLGDGI